MPGRYEALKDLIDSGKLTVLGVVQEQHAERTRLFAQWKQLKFPIAQDCVNMLGSRAVPLEVALDEHGIVRKLRPDVDWIRNEFVKQDFPAPHVDQASADKVSAEKPDLAALHAEAKQLDSREAWLRYGDAQMFWGAADEISSAVDAYNRMVQLEIEDAVAHFRLGVALRARHETHLRQQSDFQRAVGHWTYALSQDPNHYIWRRRIQQYGPRLTKPYPFYDWVDQGATRDPRAWATTGPVACAVDRRRNRETIQAIPGPTCGSEP